MRDIDRAGQLSRSLSADELRVVFDVVVGQGTRGDARTRLESRDATTVNRAYNVITQFQLRDSTSCDDDQ